VFPTLGGRLRDSQSRFGHDGRREDAAVLRPRYDTPAVTASPRTAGPATRSPDLAQYDPGRS
jgi:hypothetical protein